MARTGSNQYMERWEPTICWDCANATGRCSWSEKLEPVKGWKAEATKVSTQINTFVDSYRVISCPQFIRDSWDRGMLRKEPKKKNG